MHIPDGYISPATCVVMYGAAAPFWYVASRRLRQRLTGRTIPLLSLFAAFCFVIQMFNIPLPGGTTGHAVGGTIIAIVLGPWAGVVAVTVALAIQALFFGDGGITALGANAFNMAVVLPFVAHACYRLIAGSAPATSTRRVTAAVVAGYVGINAAAFTTALELGVQPILFADAAGTPLYAPYGLDVAIPIMMLGHLLVAGPAEALVTGLILAYLQQAYPSLIEVPTEERRGFGLLWALLGLLVLLTPLGLLASGTAWGEWAAEELEEMGLGFIPHGLAALSGLWQAPLPDYTVGQLDERLAYILSGALGVALVVVACWGLGRWLLVARQRRAGGE